MTGEEIPTIGAVLLVEDSETDAFLIRRELEKAWPGVRIVRLQTGERLARTLAESRWDVVLSDHEMPGFSAAAALELCRELAPDTPFLVVSGKIGEESAVAMLKAGAADYIVKDRLSMLVPAIGREVREARRKAEHRLLEKQLLRAQRLESIGLLASGIAHDLNNIFLPLKMVLGLLKGRLDDEEGRKYLALLEGSVEKGSELTRQMLSFVRGEKGGGSSTVDPAGLLRDVGKMMGVSFPKRISIVCQTPDALDPVVGNPTQIQQVLLNLCINARDAMPDGGTLRLSGRNARLDGAEARSVSPEAEPGRYVVLSVSDTGTGIPEALRDRIFDPFFSTKSSEGGTGLGLSTALRIVRGHRGFLVVRSEPGAGSEFSAWFPVAEAGAAPGPEAEAAPALSESTGEAVLVVDDERAILLLIKGILESQGYRVVPASNGAEALHRFGEMRDEIRCVVLDFVMPVLDGPETVRGIRRICPDVPILYISGSDSAQLGDRVGEVQGLLEKPFSMEELLSAVQGAIRNGRRD